MSDESQPEEKAQAAPKKRWAAFKRLMRGLHRDAGALAVGLTIVYAISGLAVNHVLDWNPSYTEGESSTYDYYGPFAGNLPARADAVLRSFGGEREEISEIYPATLEEAQVIGDFQFATPTRTFTVRLDRNPNATALQITRRKTDEPEQEALFQEGLKADPAQAARQVLALHEDGSALRSFRPQTQEDIAALSTFQVISDQAEYHVSILQGVAVQVEREPQPRYFLAAANWLHTNRGKAAWTWFADGYAILLIFLALSGILLLPKGRKGLLGRGGILLLIGILIPLIYFYAMHDHSKQDASESEGSTSGASSSEGTNTTALTPAPGAQ